MSKKDFNDAMFGMFGVNKETESEQAPAPAAGEQPKADEAANTSSESKSRNGVTYLAPNSAMEGKLQTEGDVEIAGTFNGDIIAKGKVILHSNMQGNITAASLQLLGCALTGNISSSGAVMLDRSASVIGSITAGELVSSGKIKGDLDVKGNIALNETASVEGDIITKTMTMSQGAVITGNVKMNNGKNQAE